MISEAACRHAHDQHGPKARVDANHGDYIGVVHDGRMDEKLPVRVLRNPHALVDVSHFEPLVRYILRSLAASDDLSKGAFSELTHDELEAL